MVSPSRFAVRAARVASFTAFLSTLLIYSPNVMVLHAFDADALTGYFAEPYLLGALVVAAAVALVSYRRRFEVDALLGRPVLAGLACALYALANVVYVAALFLRPVFAVPLVAACALVGAAAVLPVCVAWGRSFGELDLGGAVGVVAIAMGCSALCNVVVAHVPGPAAAALFVLFTLAGAVGPLVFSTPAPGDSEPVSNQSQVSVDARAFLSIMGVPLLGMAIASFAMGVQPAFLLDGTLSAQRVGMVAGSLGLLPLALTRLRAKQPVYAYIYQVYLPVAAVVALVLCLLPVQGLFADVVGAVVYGFYAMVSGLAVAAACAIANAREFSRSFVFASLLGSFCISGVIGLFLGGRIEALASNNLAVLLVLTGLYGGWILLAGCLKSWQLTVHPVARSLDGQDALETPREAPTFESRLEELAARASLSPRETQIVGYVGRGHSSVYVAKTLLISESTVYSHVRNVYRKLGISSREELIQLLNAPTDDRTCS